MFKDKTLRSLLGFQEGKYEWQDTIENFRSALRRIEELERNVALLEEYLSVVQEEVKTNGMSDGIEYIKVSRKEFEKHNTRDFSGTPLSVFDF